MGQLNSIINNLQNRKIQSKTKMDEEVPNIKDKYEDDAQDMINVVLGLLTDKSTVNIELSFICENLFNMDIFSLSDPMIVVYLKSESETTYIGRTEVIRDNLNPKFTK